MSIFRRIKNKLTRSEHQQDVDAEMQSHIEMRIADAIAAACRLKKRGATR